MVTGGGYLQYKFDLKLMNLYLKYTLFTLFLPKLEQQLTLFNDGASYYCRLFTKRRRFTEGAI
jgi:hypothetical protein